MTYLAVKDWLVEHASLEPSLLEGAGFEGLIAERMTASRCSIEADYLSLLGSSEAEVNRLIAGVAVPETWLFRYPLSFQLLVEFLARRRAGGGATVRMRSIGCAGGEEPYCMVMAALHAGWDPEAVLVEAVDRNPEVLRRAAAGEYGGFSVRTELPGWAMQYLGRSGATITVDPLVRSRVRFVRADVLRTGSLAAGGLFDVVFCRNVLIYLGANARAHLLSSICDSLKRGGLLFVGHAEQLLCTEARLKRIDSPHAFALEHEPERATVETVVPVARQVFQHAPSGSRTQPASATAHRLDPAPVRACVHEELSLDDAGELADAGRATEGEAAIRAHMSRHGPSARALELLGMLRMASNDVPGAKLFFEQAVYLEPARAASLLQLAMISEKSGDPGRAAILWDRARRATVRAGEGGRS